MSLLSKAVASRSTSSASTCERGSGGGIIGSRWSRAARARLRALVTGGSLSLGRTYAQRPMAYISRLIGRTEVEAKSAATPTTRPGSERSSAAPRWAKPHEQFRPSTLDPHVAWSCVAGTRSLVCRLLGDLAGPPPPGVSPLRPWRWSDRSLWAMFAREAIRTVIGGRSSCLKERRRAMQLQRFPRPSWTMGPRMSMPRRARTFRLRGARPRARLASVLGPSSSLPVMLVALVGAVAIVASGDGRRSSVHLVWLTAALAETSLALAYRARKPIGSLAAVLVVYVIVDKVATTTAPVLFALLTVVLLASGRSAAVACGATLAAVVLTPLLHSDAIHPVELFAVSVIPVLIAIALGTWLRGARSGRPIVSAGARQASPVVCQDQSP